MNEKITTEHLTRTAYVYVRQSSPGQVRHNKESRRRQYALQDHAKELGWEHVEVIDEDQGRTGTGVVDRKGFDDLLEEVCRGSVGAVFALEMSRLARNGSEWHKLMEFCAIVDTLLIDEQGIYNPRNDNDKLFLGIKGEISYAEISTLLQRAHVARKQKAERGEYYSTVAVGYVRDAGDGLVKDPDVRVRDTIELIFRKFTELGSARKTYLWLHDEDVQVPHVSYEEKQRCIVWRKPTYITMLHLLRNPVYAGAYVYGRRRTEVTLQNGRRRKAIKYQKNPADWFVLIKDHHDGYISWDVFENNQNLITHNANMNGQHVRGSIRHGEALLVGLLRCGHCGRKLVVHYGGPPGTFGRYVCYNIDGTNTSTRVCISFGSIKVDAAIREEVLRRLQPLGIEAALHAIDVLGHASDDVCRHIELALEQARYEAGLARRQYDSVDPFNRLVASELERRWNEKLAVVADLEGKLADTKHGNHENGKLSQDERQELLALGADLPKLWDHPGSSPETRKRILRTMIKEIIVNVAGDQIQMKLHWHGGDHTELVVHKNATGKTRFSTDIDTIDLVRMLARLLTDGGIAGLLNRLGKLTIRGNTWTAHRVCALRNNHDIAVYRDGERAERGEVNLKEAAQILQVRQMAVLRLIQRKVLPASQPCVIAPWTIRRADLDSPAVRRALASANRSDDPVTSESGQESLDFQ
jgi:DNA invertase Pin-like site-specific DNA recombinase